MRYLDATNFQGSDSEESLLPDERDSFASQQLPQDSPFKERSGLQVSELMKQQAKDQALKSLNKPIDKKLNSIGQRAGFSGEALSGLSKDTEENRERLKAEAKERASKYIKEKVGDQLEKKVSREAGKKVAEQAGKKVAQKAGKVATEQAVKQGGKLAAKAAEKGIFKIAEAAAGPETLGLGTVAIWLLEVAVNLGINDAIDALFELKNGNIKKAYFHAVKAIYLIIMFVGFLVILILSITVIGLIVTIIPIILLNVYVVMGFMFPDNPALQGFSRKWEIAALFLLDIFVIIMIIAVAAGVLYGICTQTAIGSLIGWTGIIGDAINYLDTNYGTGGAIAGLNQACAAVQSFR